MKIFFIKKERCANLKASYYEVISNGGNVTKTTCKK